MKENFISKKLGILGGGQLGRMLLQKAADFSLSTRVLDPDSSAPSRYITEEFIHGSFTDYNTVYSFGKSCDIVTIEIENVNTTALLQLEKEGIKVYPQPDIIRLIQDKGDQKKFFSDNKIPTAEFRIINSKKDLEKNDLSFPVMQKLRKGGYDGRGVFRIDTREDFHKAFDEPSILEALINFRKEIAVIVARSISGECKCFPLVDMQFNPQANLVEYLFSPADVSSSVEREAQQLAIRIAGGLKIVGVLAVEMFLTDDDRILVNEIAPRPHNSGHHTIEANLTSQYEQHLRAILGLPLGSTASVHPAVMVNLLGEKNYDGIAYYENLDKVLAMESVYVHLYGKKFTRPFRKMGHVTATGKTLDDARAKAIEIKKLLRVISE